MKSCFPQVFVPYVLGHLLLVFGSRLEIQAPSPLRRFLAEPFPPRAPPPPTHPQAAPEAAAWGEDAEESVRHPSEPSGWSTLSLHAVKEVELRPAAAALDRFYRTS